MLGIVFTEMAEMVEAKFSEDMLDDILDDCPELKSGGSYTAVGKYDHDEMLALVTALSKRTDIPVSDLVFTFGEHLFGRFHELYPMFFENVGGAFDFLARIENHIHVEVKKLYPDAELPEFDCDESEANQLRMVYRSSRPFADLAAGLIEGCIKHYGESITVSRSDKQLEAGSETEFTLVRH